LRENQWLSVDDLTMHAFSCLCLADVIVISLVSGRRYQFQATTRKSLVLVEFVRFIFLMQKSKICHR